MDLGLGGARVLTTAGAAGIGRAIAEAFAREGAKVHVCDVDVDALASLLGTVELRGAVCDVSNRSAVERYVALAAEEVGSSDILVDIAGIRGPTAVVADVDATAWAEGHRGQPLRHLSCPQCALPHLKESAAASITVMSSLAGPLGYPNGSAYWTSK